MKRSTLVWIACLAAGVPLSCSQDPGAPVVQQNGDAGSGSRPSTSTGGTGTTGGTNGNATGGASSGGSVASGGTGGASTGTGGSGTAGTGAVGTGGTAGTGPTGVTVQDIVPTLDGYLWTGACVSAGAGLDCKLVDPCPNANAADFSQRGFFMRKTHAVGGDPNTKYRINFEVRGVTGGKTYTGGKQGNTQTGNWWTAKPEGNNTWYIGGQPTDTKWNTYELHVTPPVSGEANSYYFNAFPAASTYDGWHGTFVIKFTASFVVMGGSTLELVIHDSNCNGQQNCGQTPRAGADSCAAPRTVDLAGMDPPAKFAQPYSQDNGLNPQWLYWDVKSIDVL